LAATAGPEAVLAFGAPQPTAAALLLLRGGCAAASCRRCWQILDPVPAAAGPLAIGKALLLL